jgi:hypothetical protein
MTNESAKPPRNVGCFNCWIRACHFPNSPFLPFAFIAGRFRRRRFFCSARPAAAVSRRRARNTRWTRSARTARWRAAWLAAKRICRCHPWGRCGHDPVPRKSRIRRANSELNFSPPGAFNLSWIAPASSLSRSAPSCSCVWFVEQQKYAQQQARFAATNQVAQTQSQFAAAANSNAVSPVKCNPTALPVPGFRHQHAGRIAGHHQCPRPLHVHFARRRVEIGGIAGLSRNRLAALEKERAAKDGVATLNTRAPVPVLAILGDASLVGDGNFTLTQTADGVRAEKSFCQRPAAREGISSQLELSGERERAAGKHLGPAARAARAGMGRRHGDADGAGRQRHMNEGAMWFNGTKSALTSRWDGFPARALAASRRAAFGISGRLEQRRLGGGAQPVFRADGDAQGTGGANHRAAGDAAAIPERRAGAGRTAPQGIQTRWFIRRNAGGAIQAVERQIVLFAGPKEYRLLARIGDQFQNQADLVMNFGRLFRIFCARRCCWR